MHSWSRDSKSDDDRGVCWLNLKVDNLSILVVGFLFVQVWLPTNGYSSLFLSWSRHSSFVSIDECEVNDFKMKEWALREYRVAVLQMKRRRCRKHGQEDQLYCSFPKKHSRRRRSELKEKPSRIAYSSFNFCPLSSCPKELFSLLLFYISKDED